MEKNENQKDNKGIVIVLLTIIIVMLIALCVLFTTGTISLKNKTINNDTSNTGNNEKEVVDNKETEELKESELSSEKESKIENKINSTVEKFLGTWYLDEGRYTHLNIKKSTDNTGYTIDILVNKMADYKDLKLNCADNAGTCYASGDTNHNFTIMMLYDQITVIPDYATSGTIWVFTYR